MTAPIPPIVGAVTDQISKAEKGGLFVVLVIVLFLGYDVYTKGQEQEKTLITNQLAVISSQQVALQRAIDDMRRVAGESLEHNRAAFLRLEALEGTALSYVYNTDDHIVFRTPKSAGNRVLRVELLPTPASHGGQYNEVTPPKEAIRASRLPTAERYDNKE